MRFLFVVSLLASSLFAADPVRDVTYLSPFYPQIPKFDKGYLFENPRGQELIVCGPNGDRLFAAAIPAPYGSAEVIDAAVDSQGAFAVSILYFNEQEFVRGAIVFLDP